ncbi:MAG: hypothetical protein ABJG88_11845, partial [Litorimonas sp.]
RNQGIKPTRIVTDKLGSYGAALKLIGLEDFQDGGGRKTIAPNVHMFQLDEENERPRSLDPWGTLKDCFQPTAKSTISSITDAISSLETHSVNSDMRLRLNGI